LTGFLNEDLASDFSRSFATWLQFSAEMLGQKTKLGCVVPRRRRFHVGFGDVHLDHIANGDEADKPASLDHWHVAAAVYRHFRHQPVDGVGLAGRNHSLGHVDRHRQ
jgi:hypothetical protein